MAKRKVPYLNKFNGDIKIVSKQEAKKLSEDYAPIEFTTNDQGERVMRMHLNGATVDVLENEEAKDGIATTK